MSRKTIKTNEDLRILKDLGIIERSRHSRSSSSDEDAYVMAQNRLSDLTEADYDQALNNTPRVTFSTTPRLTSQYRSSSRSSKFVDINISDEDDVLFEQTDRLIQRSSTSPASSIDTMDSIPRGRPKQQSTATRKAVACRMVLCILAFFNMGMSLAIVGVTIPTLQNNIDATASSFTRAISLISFNAMGAIFGLFFASCILNAFNPIFLILCAMFVCAISTILLPWLSSFVFLTFVMILQGFTFGFIERCVYKLFHFHWKGQYRVLLAFYSALAVGACLATMTTSPFVTNVRELVNLTDDDVTSTSSTWMSSMSSTGSNRRRLVRQATQTLFPMTSDIDDNILGNDTLDVNGTLFSTRVEDLISTATPGPKKPVVADSSGDSEQGTFIAKKKQKEEQLNRKAAVGAPLSTTISTLPTLTPENGTTGENDTLTTASNETSTDSTNTTFSVEPPSTTASTTMTASVSLSSTTKLSSTTMSPSVEPTVSTSTIATKPSAPAQSTEPPISTSTSVSTPKPEMNPLERFLLLVRDSNRGQFAYLIIGLFQLIICVLFFGICCCNPCSPVPNQTGIIRISGKPDDFSTKTPGYSSRVTVYTVIFVSLFVFLLEAISSCFYNLLAVFVALVSDSGSTEYQHLGGTLITLFWFVVVAHRVFMLIFHSKLRQAVVVFISIGFMLVLSGAWAVFMDMGVGATWIGVGGVAFGIGSSFPLVYIWLDQGFGVLPWVQTLLLTAGHLGRATVPVLVASLIQSSQFRSPRIFCTAILVSALFLLALFTVVCRLAKRASALEAVGAFSKEFNGPPKIYEPRDIDPNGLAMDAIDDFLYDDTVHFEGRGMSGEVNTEEGAFGSYFLKK